jgi:hypothetical protein
MHRAVHGVPGLHLHRVRWYRRALLPRGGWQRVVQLGAGVRAQRDLHSVRGERASVLHRKCVQGHVLLPGAVQLRPRSRAVTLGAA